MRMIYGIVAIVGLWTGLLLSPPAGKCLNCTITDDINPMGQNQTITDDIDPLDARSIIEGPDPIPQKR